MRPEGKARPGCARLRQAAEIAGLSKTDAGLSKIDDRVAVALVGLHG